MRRELETDGQAVANGQPLLWDLPRTKMAEPLEEEEEEEEEELMKSSTYTDLNFPQPEEEPIRKPDLEESHKNVYIMALQDSGVSKTCNKWASGYGISLHGVLNFTEMVLIYAAILLVTKCSKQWISLSDLIAQNRTPYRCSLATATAYSYILSSKQFINLAYIADFLVLLAACMTIFIYVLRLESDPTLSRKLALVGSGFGAVLSGVAGLLTCVVEDRCRSIFADDYYLAGNYRCGILRRVTDPSRAGYLVSTCALNFIASCVFLSDYILRKFTRTSSSSRSSIFLMANNQCY